MSLMLHEMLLGPTKADVSVGVVANALSTTSSITYPAGIQAGDLIILADRASSGANPYPATVTPAGFTLLSSESSSAVGGGSQRQRVNVSWRLATGPLTGSVTGMNGSVADGKVMYVLRRIDLLPIATVTPFAYPSDNAQGVNSRSVSVPASTIPEGSLFLSFATAVNGETITSHTLSPQPYPVTQLSPATYMSSLFSNFLDSNPAMTVTGVNNGVAPRGGGVTTAAYLKFT